MAFLPDCPPSLKSIQHYLKTAAEHDTRDVVVAYWCRIHALQLGLKLKKQDDKDEIKLLTAIMSWLEEQKTKHKDNEAITNQVVAQAHLDNYALKLFMYAYKQDQSQNYDKNVVKAFYTSGMIYDVLTEFGELSDEAATNRKHAKYRAAYIHNCLKNGEIPEPVNLDTEDDTSSAQDTPAAPGSTTSSLPDPSIVNQLPTVPYTPDPNPGGFVPYQGPSSLQPLSPSVSIPSLQLSPEQISKAQKYCKWASSALNYDDVKTAVTNLQNALQLLQTGRDPA